VLLPSIGFIFTVARKIAIKQSLNIPPHLKYVTTLPCKMLHCITLVVITSSRHSVKLEFTLMLWINRNRLFCVYLQNMSFYSCQPSAVGVPAKRRYTGALVDRQSLDSAPWKLKVLQMELMDISDIPVLSVFQVTF